eukprot:7163867-Karenia_brevis.AAC.1
MMQSLCLGAWTWDQGQGPEPSETRDWSQGPRASGQGARGDHNIHNPGGMFSFIQCFRMKAFPLPSAIRRVA